ncbi:hypothetical protein GH721_03105 [Kriegella sp. EG-1]|nr:hypothetical protein [Flavobacteriaceae bacterium EG-1]
MKNVILEIIPIKLNQSISILVLFALLLFLLFSCTNDDNQTPIADKAIISQEIKDLIYLKGDESASTVLINVPGGPSTKLNTEIADLIYGLFNTTDILNVTVHQAQTLDSTIVKVDDITLNEAININKESINILHQVVSYFKNQGRTVYILGFSFGAFVTQELIATNGINSADKYLIMTGRLDINDSLWQASSEGKEGWFENGVTPIVDSEPLSNAKERNLLRISAGLGKNRYTQLLNDFEDLSKVTYVYGKTDEAVGSLTSEEVDFLETKNTKIIAGSGDHTATFEDFIIQGLEETFGIELLE